MNMDFSDKLKQFSKRAEKVKNNLATEEATKTALIMPFFQLLDYDVFNPDEFIPEFTADVGTKKGEKVDYAIMENGKPVILIEAKNVDDDLIKHDAQLFRYFTSTDAKFAILTNGLIYKFYTDLEERNKMDESPFLELNILDLNDVFIQELKKFKKENFDIDTIFDTASELKYTSLIKSQMNKELNNPSDEFVRFIINEFYNGVKTQNVVEKFRPIVKKSFQQFINDFMSDRLKSILNTEEQVDGDMKNSIAIPTEMSEISTDIDEENKNSSKIVTTQEELESFYIIKSILSEVVDPNDITNKDVEKYFNVLYQNNTRKWICRLYLGGNKQSMVLNDGNRIYINNINDIYKYKTELIGALHKYINVQLAEN